ncbi:hypothetical protein FB384_002185 [Prauserella sediminis]|uniref:DUF4244 domain-containing protein n=2 Tax=Prauserella sediminis TaxID=577680 RepID=A0A839XKK1_9PSEU|nr:hypothetical protein [Prauserella sediminis]
MPTAGNRWERKVMNTVMTIVRTVLPFARPASTNAVSPRDGASSRKSAAAPRSDLRTAEAVVDDATVDKSAVDEPAVDLAALIPRQPGPERERVPCDGGIGAEPPGNRHGERSFGGGDGRTVAVPGRAEPDDAHAEKEVDAGMSTAEYAIGTLAAAALAAVLYMIVTGDSVTSALTSLIEQALSVDF